MHSPEMVLKKLQGWNAGVLPHKMYFYGIFFFFFAFCIKKKKKKIVWSFSALLGNRLFGNFLLKQQDSFK